MSTSGHAGSEPATAAVLTLGRPRPAAGDPVRIGLIGGGRMGRTHLQALAGAPGVRIVAVAEPSSRAREELTAAGHRVFAGCEQMLASAAVDAALIAAPSDQHRPIVAELAARGVPMLCEKPLGVTAADAAAAVAAAAEHDVALQVGYWRRFVPALRELRARIAGGELGEIYQLCCLQWDGEPPDPAFRAHSGGIAVDMAVHEIDQARWLTGQEFTSVSAVACGAAGTSAEDPDAATILGALSGGAATTISLGRRFPHGDCCWVEVFGARGHERVEFMWGAAGDDVFTAALRAQAEAFAASLGGRRSDASDGDDAITALRVAECAREALIDGRCHAVAAADAAAVT
ncbi:MAG: Gfo/Idh/MocA family oxidoreductase [Solirubrobacteraceae bacterium]